MSPSRRLSRRLLLQMGSTVGISAALIAVLAACAGRPQSDEEVARAAIIACNDVRKKLSTEEVVACIERYPATKEVQVDKAAIEEAEKVVTQTSRETLVTSFTGSGAQTTRPFTVSDRWEIQWDASGDLFQIYLYGARGDIVGVAANQLGPGSGRAFQPGAGSYYLQMNAMGNWTVRVVQLG